MPRVARYLLAAMIEHETIMKDCLYNLAPNSGASFQYCTGIAVGVISTLMTCGLSFQEAIRRFAVYMPKKHGTRLAVPESWRVDLLAALRADGYLVEVIPTPNGDILKLTDTAEVNP